MVTSLAVRAFGVCMAGPASSAVLLCQATRAPTKTQPIFLPLDQNRPMKNLEPIMKTMAHHQHNVTGYPPLPVTPPRAPLRRIRHRRWVTRKLRPWRTHEGVGRRGDAPFTTNRLLARRQFVLEVIHPGRARQRVQARCSSDAYSYVDSFFENSSVEPVLPYWPPWEEEEYGQSRAESIEQKSNIQY